MKNKNLSVGILGILVVVSIVIIFGSESILALIRTRNISATVEIVDSATSTTPATPDLNSNATPPAANAVQEFTMLTDGTITLHITWAYKIGPRFPKTVVQSDLLDQNGQSVAADTYTIDCGTNTLDCNGSVLRPLQATNGKWAIGDYRLQMNYNYVDFGAKPLLTRVIHIRETR